MCVCVSVCLSIRLFVLCRPNHWTYGPKINLEDDHTPSGPTLGGPNTESTIAGTLLGSSGENVAKLGTILPLSYQSLGNIIFWTSPMGKESHLWYIGPQTTRRARRMRGFHGVHVSLLSFICLAYLVIALECTSKLPIVKDIGTVKPKGPT